MAKRLSLRASNLRVPPGRSPAVLPNGRPRPFIGIPVALLLVVVAGMLSALTIRCIADELQLRALSLESAEWTEVAGTIDSSVVATHRSSKDVRYEPDIHYRYTVDGRSYSGERVLFTTHYSQTKAFDLVLRYRPGDSVIVWIRPGQPGCSVLLRQSWNDWVEIMLAGVGLMLFLLTTAGGGVAAFAALRTHLVPANLHGKEAFLAATMTTRDDELGPGSPTALGTLVEATDSSLVFVRRHRDPTWRLWFAAVGAVLGPLVAPLAPLAWWVAAIVVVVPALSLAIAYAALPEIALAFSSSAPLRFRLRVARDDVDPYRGEPLCTARVDGRAMGPSAHRMLVRMHIDRLVADVLVIGKRTAILAYAFGAEPGAGRQIREKGAWLGPASVADLMAALSRVLHTPIVAVRFAAVLPGLRVWPLLVWLGVRAGLYCAIARVAPVDPHLGLLVALGSALAILPIEAGVYWLAISARYVPHLEALLRALREQAPP